MALNSDKFGNTEGQARGFLVLLVLTSSLYIYWNLTLYLITKFYLEPNNKAIPPNMKLYALFIEPNFHLYHLIGFVTATIIGITMIIFIFKFMKKKTDFQREKIETTADLSKKDFKKEQKEELSIDLGYEVGHDTEYTPNEKPKKDKVTLSWSNFVRHLLMLAPTGMGKSEILKTLIQQFIKHKNRPTLIIFDPKADLTHDVQALAKLAGREKDLIILPEYGYNPLSLNNDFSLENIDNTISRVNTALFSMETSTSSDNKFYKNMQEVYCSRAIKLYIAAECQEPTLKDIERIMSNEDYRTKLKAKAAENHKAFKENASHKETIIVRENFLVQNNNYENLMGPIIKIESPKEKIKEKLITYTINGTAYKLTENNHLYEKIGETSYKFIGKLKNNKISKHKIGQTLFEIIQQEKVKKTFNLTDAEITFDYYDKKLTLKQEEILNDQDEETKYSQKLYDNNNEEVGYVKDNYIIYKDEEIAEIKIKFSYISAPGIIDAHINYDQFYKTWKEDTYIKNVDDLRNRIAKITEGDRGVLYNQRNSKNLYHLINNNKIIIIRAGSGEAIEKARGLMFVNTIQSTIMARAQFPKEKFPETACILDEFHFYVSESFPTFITTCRSTNTGLLLAFQSIGQLEESIFDTVIGNCAIKIALGGMDFATAEKFAKEFGYEYYINSAYSKAQGNLTQNGNETRSKELQFRIHPTKLSEMPEGHMIISINKDRRKRPPIYCHALPLVQSNKEEQIIYRAPINYESNPTEGMNERDNAIKNNREQQAEKEAIENQQKTIQSQNSSQPQLDYNNITLIKVGNRWLTNDINGKQWITKLELESEEDNQNPSNKHIYKGVYTNNTIILLDIVKRGQLEEIITENKEEMLEISSEMTNRNEIKAAGKKPTTPLPLSAVTSKPPIPSAPTTLLTTQPNQNEEELYNLGIKIKKP